MKDFCKHIHTENTSYSDLRKKYWDDVQKLYKQKGTKVATNDEILEWLKWLGWSNQELAQAHVPSTIVVKGFVK